MILTSALLLLAQGPVLYPRYGDHRLGLPTGPEWIAIDGPPLAQEPPDGFPLLVLFNTGGEDHSTFYSGASGVVSYFTSNGFIVMMHDGGTNQLNGPQTFASETFQAHTRAAIKYVLNVFPIDERRIYAWGRSMGGGEALVFASRHRDPHAPWGMFAAAVNHSGTVGVPRTYFATLPIACGNGICFPDPAACSGTPCQVFYEQLYGSTSYCTQPYPFQRAAIVDIPGCVQTAGFDGDASTSLVRNLMFLRVRTSLDPTNVDLVAQNEELLDIAPALPDPPGMILHHEFYNVADHGWDDLDEAAILSFFNAPESTLPFDMVAIGEGQGTLFTEAGTRFDHLEALPPAGFDYATDGFGHTAWTRTGVSELTLWTRSEVAELTIVVDEYTWLDLDQNLTLDLEPNFLAPGSIELSVRGYGSCQPLQVLDHTGTPLLATEWTWDPVTETITFTVDPTESGDWTIVPDTSC